jgi:hypothetical protein
MEAKKYIQHELETRKTVIMTSLDVTGAFDAAWWPSILKVLQDSGCPRNLYYLSQGYFRQRTAVMSTNSQDRENGNERMPTGVLLWTRLLEPLIQFTAPTELKSHPKTINIQPDNIRRTQKPEKPRAPHRINKDEGDPTGEQELEHTFAGSWGTQGTMAKS